MGIYQEKKKSKQAVISIVFFLEIMKKRRIQDILGEMNLLKEQETIAYNANNPICLALLQFYSQQLSLWDRKSVV